MESIAGLGVSLTSGENFRTQSSLSHIQLGLGESDLLLSFYLGRQESYVWTVTRSSLALHRLPPEGELREEIAQFHHAVMPGLSEGTAESAKAQRAARESLGANLYQRLLGWMDAKESAKTAWLLSLDGPLFDLPFAALVSGYENGRPVYVVERHSIVGIPGALFLNPAPSAMAGNADAGERFLGVGDAVYNAADPRWRAEWRPWGLANAWSSPGNLAARWAGGQPLNRLVATSRELSRSSQSWQASTAQAGSVQILEGMAAARDTFVARLAATHAPLTIHLATHVLNAAVQPEEALLAFSLDAGGIPGLLSTTEVGLLHVPEALVVMTGCATATGDIRPGAGLRGLAHAWLIAGARSVLATNWPIQDSDGDLVPGFYRHLLGNSPAEALRRSQIDLIHSGTWQAAPSYWAAFQVIGGGR
jgi:CHAT domain-containing protein